MTDDHDPYEAYVTDPTTTDSERTVDYDDEEHER